MTTRTADRLHLLAIALILSWPRVGGAVCTSPAGSAGQLSYNTTAQVFQYCNGTTWIAADAKQFGIVGWSAVTAALEGGTEVAVYGNYAYVSGSKTGILGIVNISNPAAPTVAGNLQDAVNLKTVVGLATNAAGTYLYAAARVDGDPNNARFTVVDVTSASNPFVVASITDSSLAYLYDLRVVGNYAYVLSYFSDTLTIIDVSTPASPVVIGRYTDSAHIYRPRNLAVQGAYAYIASSYGDNIGAIVDISTPSAPTFVAEVLAGACTFAEAGEASGSYAYFACNTESRLLVVDVSTPTSPVVVGSVVDATRLQSMYEFRAAGSYLYVTCYAGLTVVDVSTPANPTVVGNLAVSSSLDGLAKAGNYVYLPVAPNDTLVAVSVVTPSSPTTVGTVASGMHTVGAALAKSGNYVVGVGGDSFTVYGVADPRAPAAIGIADLPLPTGQDARGVTSQGSYAYVTSSNNDRVVAISIATPTLPTVCGSYTSSTYLDQPRGIAVSGNYAYVAAYASDRVTVLDISTPCSPTFVGSVQDVTNLDNVKFVFVDGNYVFATTTSGRVTTVDVTNKAAPVVVGTMQDATYIADVWTSAYAAGYVYSGDWSSPNYLSITDVTTPTAPTRVSSTTPAANYFLTAVAGTGFVIHAAGSSLYVTDAATPSTPVLKGTVTSTFTDMPGGAVADANYAYHWYAGMLVVTDLRKFTSPGAPCTGAGWMDYDVTTDVLYSCNGTSRVDFGPNPGAGGSGCTTPVGTRGTIDYDTTSHRYRYCDGAQWRNFGE